VAILIALSVHEFSHALAGHLLHDDTAKDQGRLTLNPLAHVDMFGFLMLLLVGFGWGKPVPVNPYNLKYRKWGETLVALAGPLANLLMVVVFGLILKFAAASQIFSPDNLLIQLLNLLVVINVVLLLFNIIPIPPLDGSKFLLTALPARFNQLKIWLLTRGPFLLLALIILDNFFGVRIFSRFFYNVINLVYGLF